MTEVLVDTLTAQWTGSGEPSDGVMATNLSIQTSGNFSTFTLDLTFAPLRQSHDGDYVCTANLATFTDSHSTEVLTIGKLNLKIRSYGHAVENVSFPSKVLWPLAPKFKLVIVILCFIYTVPLVEVHISGDGVVEFGESLVLDCVFSGANNLEGNITFQWGGPNRAREESTSTQLVLNAVGFSDAGIYTYTATGIYTYTATVSSPYVNENISANDTVSVIISG